MGPNLPSLHRSENVSNGMIMDHRPDPEYGDVESRSDSVLTGPVNAMESIGNGGNTLETNRRAEAHLGAVV